MSILLDRLLGINLDESAGKTSIPVHEFVAALYANKQGAWNGTPTDAEMNAAFHLAGQPFDPGNTQVTDTETLATLPAQTPPDDRTADEIEKILQLGRRYPAVITKTRVLQMLGLVGP